jgi:hypothetical protein
MNTEVLKPILAGLARHALTSLGGYLVASGAISSSQVDTFVGAGLMIAGVLWSWWQKVGQAKVAALLQHLTATSTTADAKAVAQAVPVGAAVKAAAAVAILAIIVLGTIVPTPSFAATTAKAAPTDVLTQLMTQLQNVQANVVAGVVADINAADVDAGALTNAQDPTSVKDPIAHACYPALVKFLQTLPTATPTTGKFVAVQLFQKKRDFIAQVQAGLPTYLKLGCAPLLGDEVQTFISIMAMVGVKIAAPALTALFPPLAPLTLPALTVLP